MDSEVTLDHKALFAVFATEAEDVFAEVEQALVLLEASPQDDELLRTALRGLHTLKGNAATIGLEEISQLTHALEGPLSAAQRRAVRVTPRLVSFLLGGLDLVRDLVRAAGEEAEGAGDAAQGAQTGERRGDAAHAIRITPERADRMLALVSELATARAQIEERLERGAADSLRDALQRYRDSERLHVELEDLVMNLRAIPLEPVLRQYARVLHDAAARCGKRARLVVDAAGVELDGAIVERLRDPLLHAVRNAVDHGIEPSDERERGGKDPTGVVTLRARHDAGSVVVLVEDDGRGFDRDRILDRARRRGMVVESSLPDEEVFRLVLEPGFTTAESVSDVSGRGVGLDVLARAVSGLRGRVDVTNGPHGGAHIAVRLPLTLAIIDGFAVEAGGERFIIPSGAVDAFVDARALARARTEHGLLRWRGGAVPFVPLAKMLALPAGAREREVVMVHHAGGRAALAVDAVHGSRRVVIKPLTGPAKTTDAIAGSTIIGSGRVAFVLDVPSILRRAGAHPAADA